MKFEDVKLNGKYRVIDNKTGHDFDIGDIVQIIAIESIEDEPTEDDGHLIYAESWTKPWRGEWCIKPEEMESIDELDAKLPNWRMMVEDLLDFIEDQHENAGQMMYNEIRQLYGYPYDWTCKR